MASTILLNPDSWDLLADAAGNIALAGDPYSQAQDAASQIKLFQGEYWYNTSQGTPYFNTTLGKLPPIQLVKAQNISAALMVPGVVAAACFITALVDRNVQGQVQITNATGKSSAMGFSQ